MHFLYKKNDLRYLVLFPGEKKVHFKCILRKTCKIVCHRVRKIILMQTETRLFWISYPIGR